MDMLRHDHGRVQSEPAAIVVEAVFENQVSGNGWKRICGQLAKGNEDWAVALLVVRQTAAIFVW